MSSLIAGLWVQISLGFGEANCSYLYLGLLEDMLGDLTGLFYRTCRHYSKFSQVAKMNELCKYDILQMGIKRSAGRALT